MKSALRSKTGWLGRAALVCCLAILPLTVAAADLKLEAQLIWGTNDPKSPDPKHKPAEAAVARKLRSLPFKWANYFEVNRQQFIVSATETRRVVLSKECTISVRQLAAGKVEVTLFGKGRQVTKVSQELPKGEFLVTGGEAPNFTSWLVVLRQVD